MQFDPSHLPALTTEKWASVRDISIPLKRTEREGNGYRAELAQATCFTGGAHALRFCNMADAESMERATRIAQAVTENVNKGRRRFRMELEGRVFRAQLGVNSHDHDVQIRVLPAQAPTLADMKMPPVWRSLLLSEHLLNGGLVLITAPNGQGKTTTASAIVSSRLKAFGGMANTVEDPIELPLQGVWGNGLCIQRPADTAVEEVEPGQGYYRALIEALRQFPAMSGGGTMLFVGEIRDATTAAETLKAAASGHLVLATMHANSSEAAVRRMLTLSADARNGLDLFNAREMLASSLRAVFNQRLSWRNDGAGWGAASVVGELLWSEDSETAVAESILSASLGNLHAAGRRQASVAGQWMEGQPVSELLHALRGVDKQA